MHVYEMKPGDTLETVAKQLDIPLDTIIELNRPTYGPYPSMERPGVKIVIPDNDDIENNVVRVIEREQ